MPDALPEMAPKSTTLVTHFGLVWTDTMQPLAAVPGLITD
jgi:hypothetical protein